MSYPNGLFESVKHLMGEDGYLQDGVLKEYEALGVSFRLRLDGNRLHREKLVRNEWVVAIEYYDELEVLRAFMHDVLASNLPLKGVSASAKKRPPRRPKPASSVWDRLDKESV